MEEKVKVLATPSSLTLCHAMDCSPSGSSVQGILQARILVWVAILSSRESSWPRDQTWVSCIAGRLFYHLTYQGSHLHDILQKNLALKKIIMCAILKVLIEFVTLLLLLFTFWFSGHEARQILVALPGIWTHSPYIEKWSLNPWNAREVSKRTYLDRGMGRCQELGTMSKQIA